VFEFLSLGQPLNSQLVEPLCNFNCQLARGKEPYPSVQANWQLATDCVPYIDNAGVSGLATTSQRRRKAVDEDDDDDVVPLLYQVC